MTSGISSISSGLQALFASQSSASSALGATDKISSFGASSAASGTDQSGSSSSSSTDTSLSFSEQLSETLRAAMLQLQEGTKSSSSADGPPDPEQMFAKLDTDGDGNLSKEEFLAGKPDNVSKDQAEKLWSEIAGENSDSIGKDAFVSAMANLPGGPKTASAGGNGSDDQSYDPLDTNKDGVVSLQELMAANSGLSSASEDDLANLINSTGDSGTAGNPSGNAASNNASNASGNQNFDSRILAQLMSATGNSNMSEAAFA